MAVPHRAVVNFLASMATTPGLTATDVLVAVTTLSFDIAGLELWLPLTVGARVGGRQPHEAADGRLLQARLDRARGDGAAGDAGDVAAAAGGGLGGRPGAADAVRRRSAAAGAGARSLLAGGGELWNLYGPTETTIWSTVERGGAGRAGDDRAADREHAGVCAGCGGAARAGGRAGRAVSSAGTGLAQGIWASRS